MKRSLCALLFTLSAGCEREVSIGELLDAALSSGDTGTPSKTFSCDQTGPLFALSDGAGACPNSTGFHYALCSCGDIQASTLVSSDGFDSRQAAYAAGEASGAIGAGGALYPAAVQCGGSLIVAGSSGIPVSADLTIGGDLFDQGQLQGEHAVSVAGNARIAGDVRLDQLMVGGSLTLAPQAALSVNANAPSAEREAIMIAPPCDCTGALDVAGAIAARANSNDDAALALDPANALRALSAPIELSLPCGRYFVTDVYAPRAITLHITGRVALYVQNGIVIEGAGALTVDLADGAELDVFVGNSISAGGPVSIGTPLAPTHTRLHFGGDDTVFFASDTTLAATLYAPLADLVTEAKFELYGSALVRHVAASQGLTLHYDRALATDSCGAASCQQDDDCASALRCDHGSCLP